MLIPLVDSSLARCGGKAVGLRALAEAGLPVPTAYCLATDVYRDALPEQLPPDTVPLIELAHHCEPLCRQIDRWQPDTALHQQLHRAAEQLGWPIIVRSSATCEDLRGRSAAGVFTSVRDVTDIPGLVTAIHRCWRSLWEPAAWATLRARDSTPSAESMGVILQRQIASRSAGLVLSRDPRDPSGLWVEAVAGSPETLASGLIDPAATALPREGALPDAFMLSPPELEHLRQLTLRAEQALGCPVELEWLYDDAGVLWLVQARPQRERMRDDASPWAQPADDITLWRWDREHNPEPLSPAHASLIALLDQALPGPPALTVIEGYLYEAMAVSTPSPARPIPAADLRTELDALAVLLDRRDATAPDAPRDCLEHALDALVTFYRRYIGRLALLRRHARAELTAFLQWRAGHIRGSDSAASVDTLVAHLSLGQTHDAITRSADLHALAQRARTDSDLARWIDDETGRSPLPTALTAYLERCGVLAPCWDVAEPTLAERPDWLRAILRAAHHDPQTTATPDQRHATQREAADRLLDELCVQLPADDPRQLRRLANAARRARASAEDDDLLFARALWGVRAAMLAIGAQCVRDAALQRPEQIFGLSIDTMRDSLAAASTSTPPAFGRDAEAGLTRWRQQRTRVPPLTIQGPHCRWPAVPATALVRGLGTGGQARGQVCLIHTAEELLTRDLTGRVAVCATLIPALAIVLPQLAALVTDHGGLLSHAASLAREIGLPAVVGTQTATRQLRDGDHVLVDATNGYVVRVRGDGATGGRG